MANFFLPDKFNIEWTVFFPEIDQKWTKQMENLL